MVTWPILTLINLTPKVTLSTAIRIVLGFCALWTHPSQKPTLQESSLNHSIGRRQASVQVTITEVLES